MGGTQRMDKRLYLLGCMSVGALFMGCEGGTEGVQAAVSCGQSELIAQCPQNTTPNLTAAALSSCEQSGGLETGADPSASGEVSQACFGEGSCRVVCEFNDPCQYGVYTLSDGDGIVCNAPPGGAGDGECGMGENELNSPRDCGAICEPGETLCENGNAQILCAQNGRFMDALNCAPDEVCRNGQGCVQEMNDGPADMDMNAPEPVADAGLPIDTDMNSTVEPDMGMTVVPDMNMPIEDAAPPPVEDAAPPMEDAAPPRRPSAKKSPSMYGVGPMLRRSWESWSEHSPMSNKHASSVLAYSPCNLMRDRLEQPRVPSTHYSRMPTNSYRNSGWGRDRLAMRIPKFYATGDRISVAWWLSSTRILPRPPFGERCVFPNSTQPFFLDPKVSTSARSAEAGVKPMSSVEAPGWDLASDVVRAPFRSSRIGAPAS